MKRVILFALLCLIVISLFAGCGKQNSRAVFGTADYEYGVAGYEYGPYGVAGYEYDFYGVTGYEYGPGAAGYGYGYAGSLSGAPGRR